MAKRTLEQQADRFAIQVMEDVFGTGKGVSMRQLLDKTLPVPTYVLKHGENIPKKIFIALEEGQAAILLGEDGEPQGIIILDCSGVIRGQPIETTRAENREKRQNSLN